MHGLVASGAGPARTLTEQPRPAGWAGIEPALVALVAEGEGAGRRIRAWDGFAAHWARRRNRFVFGCRTRDDTDVLGLPQVEIERLDDTRVQRFLGNYLPEELAASAWQRLDGQPLLDLVRNPYYLSILCWLIANDGEWPASRADLLAGFVLHLLGREEHRGHPDWPGRTLLERALTGLADGMQTPGEGTRLRSRAARPCCAAAWPRRCWRPRMPALRRPSSAACGSTIPCSAHVARRSRGCRRRPCRRWVHIGRFDPDRANTVEGQVLAMTPVGCYPSGASALGIQDLAGNCWDWCASRSAPYPIRPGDGRDDPAGSDRPVLRGGAWYDHRRVARAASRIRGEPDYFCYFVGLRVVWSLANSGF